MLETADYQLGSHPFCFLKHPSMATVLCVLLMALSVLGCYCYSLSPTFLTMLALVLSTYFAFIFSKIKQLGNPGSIEEPPKHAIDSKILPEDEVVEEKKAPHEEVGELRIDESVVGSTDDSLPSRKNKRRLLDSSITTNEKLLSQIQSASSDSSVSEYGSSSENMHRLTGSSEGSISDDDDSLIEIALPDGKYVVPEEQNALFQRDLRGGFLRELSPESEFRQHELMELLSKINEEDNLIEIDIAMGSIKCSRFEIEA